MADYITICWVFLGEYVNPKNITGEPGNPFHAQSSMHPRNSDLGIVLIVFGLDLVLKMPFNGVHKVMDIGFVICSGILGYLSWTTLREQI